MKSQLRGAFAGIVLTVLQSFMLLIVLEGHTGDVTYVEWSPDSTQLVSCSRDKTAKLWDMTV